MRLKMSGDGAFFALARFQAHRARGGEGEGVLPFPVAADAEEKDKRRKRKFFLIIWNSQLSLHVAVTVLAFHPMIVPPHHPSRYTYTVLPHPLHFFFDNGSESCKGQRPIRTHSKSLRIHDLHLRVLQQWPGTQERRSVCQRAARSSPPPTMDARKKKCL